MGIEEIYKKYKIPPQLQLHQLRAAAVAKHICDNWSSDELIDADTVIKTCLLHDMGNIIKFNLELYPETLEPEGYKYWKAVQDEFVGKYGDDEHEATYLIAKELKMSDEVLEILKTYGFSNGEKTYKTTSYSAKIARYADQRIGMDGVKSMTDRHNDSRQRYKKRRNFDHLANKDRFEELASFWIEIEKQIFECCKITPEEITDESIAPDIEILKNYNE